MGIYPVVPVEPMYTITTPVFDEVTIHLDNRYYRQKSITIKKQGTSGYIQKIALNGQPVKGYFISHEDLVQGKELEISIE